VRTARNVAIIMLLAIPVAFTVTGGNMAEALLTALTMALLAGFAWMVYTFSRENQLTLATLTDGRRALLYGAIGLILLLIAGIDKLFASGGGTLLWILLFAAAVAAIWRVWMDANTYT
jgi:predicted ABC-type exoprotein transport system permease subunit